MEMHESSYARSASSIDETIGEQKFEIILAERFLGSLFCIFFSYMRDFGVKE